jgi:hypothetical protein
VAKWQTVLMGSRQIENKNCILLDWTKYLSDAVSTEELNNRIESSLQPLTGCPIHSSTKLQLTFF